ncbi:hypothetical protein M1L60_07910 [Actinoplanes sp. TRM 88003]|uniref:Uncharacterized protein n=1 Tax=Paractinoplanes aksuensis TaxID=2939490 RepID=A0ABT1DKF9_9ACTN|nr:hypothetical protein [Actinoplanes aksuensis]MCO8270520.1 hypothetical protein [Actinoplanes aksuensis]
MTGSSAPAGPVRPERVLRGLPINRLSIDAATECATGSSAPAGPVAWGEVLRGLPINRLSIGAALTA